MNQGTRSSGAERDTAADNALPDNITLRIVILAHGSGREDDLFLVLSLDTTLGQLKSRIQESLSQHPSPEHQRIIYQGRGLDDANESLRNILRHDQRAGNSSYVLHLVIRQGPAGSQPPPTAGSSASVPSHPSSNNIPQHLRQSQTQGPRFQPTQLSPHDNHMRIHNQIHLLQHSLQHQQALNRAHLVQRGQPTTSLAQPDRTRQINQRISQSESNDHSSTPDHDLASQSAASTQSHPVNSLPPNMLPSPPGVALPNTQIHHAPHMHPNQGTLGPAPHPMTSTTQMRTAIDSNGQQTRTIVNGGPTGTTTMTFRITGLNPPNPLDRPSSAPSSSPSADADAANLNVNPVPGNIQIHAQPPAIPMGFPFPPGMHLPLPIANMIPNIVNPFQQMPSTNPSPQPMAWLLSSPAGPQGIVFAPGHGFFNTNPIPTSMPLQMQPTATIPELPVQAAAPVPHQGQLTVRSQAEGAPPLPQPGTRPQPHGAGLPIPPPPPPQRAARVLARAGNDQNDVLQFVINRGWLFLRLYMFVFVFSESGTWRRILLIGAIVIYCCLPQQNPLTDGLQAVRRHFDNLIGPPNIPQRQPQRPAGNENVDPGRPTQNSESQVGPSNSTRRRAAPMPTPEETARRLLERQNRRNPNPIVDALYRFEQGTALFLASLVPGVGERHVRAREEARRIVQEEEEARRRATEEQQQASLDNDQVEPRRTDGSGELGSETEREPLPEEWKSTTQLQNETHISQATSSGVDRAGQSEGQGARSRTTNNEN